MGPGKFPPPSTPAWNTSSIPHCHLLVWEASADSYYHPEPQFLPPGKGVAFVCDGQ